MPSRRAISAFGRPTAGMISSRRSSPGCAGQRRGSRRAGISAIALAFSMVLLEVDTHSVAVFEFKGEAPRAIDVNAVPRGAETVQRMEVEPRQVHVIGSLRRI